MSAPPEPAASRSPAIAYAALAIAVAALAVALYAAIAPRPAPLVPSAPPAKPSLAMAACTGAVAESPDDPFWKIPLDRCDKAIDAIDVKAGFVSKWSVCGGAKTFEVTLDPRAVIVSSDAVHCSTTPSEVGVTFIGPLKK
jgi:peptidoglycan/LPS O-acetylase OafA/YrhL